MKNQKKFRIAYLSGPVDASDVYTRWKASKHTQLFGTSYLMQFFDLCRELDAEAYVITTLPGTYKRQVIGNVTIENRPPSAKRGWRYHLSMVASLLSLAPSLHRFKPAVFVITAHQNYWFVLFYAKFLGAEIVPSAHCVMWRPYGPNPAHWRFLLWLNGLFLKYFVRRAMAISDVVGKQLEQLAKSRCLEVELVTPTYDLHHFGSIPPSDFASRPFRVLFNGRIEANKGVFDLLAIAARIERERPGEFQIDMCGDGSALQEVRSQVQNHGLCQTVSIHGFCDKERMAEILAASHVIIVPTRSDFEEGLAKSCVEAVLACRPFVTSPICPALSSLGAAALAVPPDDVQAYGDALLLLADNPTLYEQKTLACLPLQEQFYDPNRAYKAILRRQLDKVYLGFVNKA